MRRSSAHTLVACPDCDLLQHAAPPHPGSVLVCRRCRATLRKPSLAAHDSLLALTIAALILLVLANGFSLAGLSVQGQAVETTLPGAIAALWSDELHLLAGLVVFTTIVAPAAELLILTYVLAYRRLDRRPRFGGTALRCLHAVDEWSMTEVFMLGALVALVKLGDYAQVHFGIALWCLGGAMLLLFAVGLRFDRDEAWTAWGPAQ